jgi:inhibitor of KinA sporulation pathway (predicted exonuclease)
MQQLVKHFTTDDHCHGPDRPFVPSRFRMFLRRVITYFRENQQHFRAIAITKRYYIVIDFEATCWGNDSRRGDEEIIEFGAVKMSQRTGKIFGEFSSFVRPERYPNLSDYCIKLTGITQKDVDTAPTFPYVLTAFVEWMGDADRCTFCSWGALDHYLLRKTCRFYNVPYPFDDDYLNIKPAFSEAVSGRGVSMERAMEMMELEFEGRQHRGIDDARNIARLWQAVLRGDIYRR